MFSIKPEACLIIAQLVPSPCSKLALSQPNPFNHPVTHDKTACRVEVDQASLGPNIHFHAHPHPSTLFPFISEPSKFEQ